MHKICPAPQQEPNNDSLVPAHGEKKRKEELCQEKRKGKKKNRNGREKNQYNTKGDKRENHKKGKSLMKKEVSA